jgi:outer membrane protein assembly factor BamB
VANGIVYFRVNRPVPVVFAVNAATGVQIWRQGGPVANIISSPTVIDGRVYVAFTDGTIQALDATMGNRSGRSYIQAMLILRWRSPAVDSISQSTTAVY